jgi:hypothetical protein
VCCVWCVCVCVCVSYPVLSVSKRSKTSRVGFDVADPWAMASTVTASDGVVTVSRTVLELFDGNEPHWWAAVVEDVKRTVLSKAIGAILSFEAQANEAAALAAEIAAKETEIAAKETEIAANKTEIAAKETEIAANKTEIAAKEAVIAAKDLGQLDSAVRRLFAGAANSHLSSTQSNTMARPAHGVEFNVTSVFSDVALFNDLAGLDAALLDGVVAAKDEWTKCAAEVTIGGKSEAAGTTVLDCASLQKSAEISVVHPTVTTAVFTIVKHLKAAGHLKDFALYIEHDIFKEGWWSADKPEWVFCVRGEEVTEPNTHRHVDFALIMHLTEAGLELKLNLCARCNVKAAGELKCAPDKLNEVVPQICRDLHTAFMSQLGATARVLFALVGSPTALHVAKCYVRDQRVRVNCSPPFELLADNSFELIARLLLTAAECRTTPSGLMLPSFALNSAICLPAVPTTAADSFLHLEVTSVIAATNRSTAMRAMLKVRTPSGDVEERVVVKLWLTTTDRRKQEWETAKSLAEVPGFAHARFAIHFDDELYALVMEDAGADLNHMCLCAARRRTALKTILERDLRAADSHLAETKRKMIDLHRGNVAVQCNDQGVPESACLLDLESVVPDDYNETASPPCVEKVFAVALGELIK